jgi:protein SCO1/2
MRRLLAIVVATGWLNGSQAAPSQPDGAEVPTRTFEVKGVVRKINAAEKTVVIAHEAITNYMDAMTMPFKVKQSKDLANLESGDEILFRLRVTETESWVEQISKTGRTVEVIEAPAQLRVAEEPKRKPHHPLLDYQFTNELGQAVSISSFRGQALGITFFFTRCPIPEFCPRLSKNFQEASQMLIAQSNAPSNWHFLSVSFDPQFDTPEVLRAYAQRYQYDPKHWSFLTGPADKIEEFAKLSDVKIEREGGFINHNFRTLIVDASGRLQTVIPIGGNLSEDIVTEILRAAGVTNPPVQAKISSMRPSTP